MRGLEARAKREADELRVEEQLNALRESQLDLTIGENGYSKLLGRAALERPNKIPLTEEYLTQFNKTATDLGGKLANPEQKLAFQRRAAILATEFRKGLLAHEMQQSRVYGDNVDNGVFKVEVENAARNWFDPEAVGNALKRIDAAVERQRQRHELSDEFKTYVRRDLRSAVHKGVLMQALGAHNMAFVNYYMKANGADMNAKDALEITAAYRKQDVASFAITEVPQIVQRAERQSEPTEYNSLLASMVADQESGNAQFDRNGKTITSPKGAVGVMQVMPATGPEAAKLAGLPWDENRLRNDPEYNRRLGEAYLNEKLRVNKNDVAKALAAYNGGQSRVDRAVKEAHAAGKPGDWVAFLKDESGNALTETQDYVAKITKRLNAGIQPAKPSRLELEREIAARAGNDMEKRKAGIEELDRQLRALDAQRKQREDETLDAAYRQLDANGGNFNALPLELRMRIPGDKLASVHSFASSAQKRVNGEDTVTDPEVYLMLSNPDVLRGQSQAWLLAFRDRLSASDFKHFSNEHSKANGQGVVAKAEDLNGAHIKTVLDNRLAGVGIDPRAKPDSDSGRQGGVIRRFVDQEILAAQKAKGDKLTEAEITKKIDELFLHSSEFKKTWFGFSTSQNKALVETRLSDLSKEQVEQYKRVFAARGQTPTDSDILALHLATQVRKKREY